MEELICNVIWHLQGQWFIISFFCSFVCFLFDDYDYQGRIQGGRTRRAPPPPPPPPLKLEKIWFFGVKSWFFTRNTPKISHLPPQLEKIWFFGVKSWFFTRNTPKISHLPPQLEKIWFFGVKSWFFTRNIPKFFSPPSARRNFFKCTPPNLKSWIRPWLLSLSVDVNG